MSFPVKLFEFPSQWNYKINLKSEILISKIGSDEDNPTWGTVLDPYLRSSVTSKREDTAMKVMQQKLNSLDSTSGAGILHVIPHHELLHSLLRLGADPETQFLKVGGWCRVLGRFLRGHQDLQDLDGGTSVHSAAYNSRTDYLQALLDVGAKVNSVTETGKLPIDLATDQRIKDMLTAAAENPFVLNLPKAVHDLKFFAVFFWMRTGNLSRAHFKTEFQGKNAVQWLTAICSGEPPFRTVADSADALLALHEIRYRYDLGPLPPSSNLGIDFGSLSIEDEEQDKENDEVCTKADLTRVEKKLDFLGEQIGVLSATLLATQQEQAEDLPK